MGKRWNNFKRALGFSGGSKVDRSGDGAKSSGPITLYILPDGFTPQVNFIGDSLDTILESAVWFYACVTANASACASLPGTVQRRVREEGESDWQRVFEINPIERFLDQPFPLDAGYPDWTWNQVLEQSCIQLDLCGDSYWHIIDTPNASRPFIEPMHPYDVEPILVNGLLSGYRWSPSARERSSGRGEVLILKPSDVIHISHTSPGKLFSGSAPARAAERSILIDRTAHERQRYNLENRAQPGLVMAIDNLFGLTDKQRETAKTFLQDQYAGAQNDGKPLVIGGATSLSSAPMSATDVHLIDTRKFTREEIMAICKTPPPIVGVYDQATLQNFGEARKLWWLLALFPRVIKVIDAFNRQLIRRKFEDRRIWYSDKNTDIGLQLLDQKLDIGLKYLSLGYPANSINAELGLGMPMFEALELPNVGLVQAGRSDSDSVDDSVNSLAPPSSTPRLSGSILRAA